MLTYSLPSSWLSASLFIIDPSFSSRPGFRPLSLQTGFVVLKQQSGLYKSFVFFCGLWVCSFWPEHILLFLAAWLRDNHVDCFLEQFILHKWQVGLRLLKNIASRKHNMMLSSRMVCHMYGEFSRSSSTPTIDKSFFNIYVLDNNSVVAYQYVVRAYRKQWQL